MHFHGKSKQWAWVGSPDSLRNPSSFRLAFHKLPSPNKRHNSPHNSNIPATKTFFPSPTVLNIPTCYTIWSHLILTFSWKNFIVGFLWVLPSYKQDSGGSCVCVCVCGQSCPPLCHPMDWHPTRLLSLWNSPVKNTGVVCGFLLQGISLTQGSNLRLLPLLHWHCLSLHHMGSSKVRLTEAVWHI